MNIKIKLVDEYPEEIFKKLVDQNLESDGIFIPAWEYYQEGDSKYEYKGTSVRIAAYDGEELIGLCWGRAEKRNRFMMFMSLVEKPYRGQGIYSRMLDLILEQTKEFDEVDSYHHLFNNKIIATKLKREFFIIGTDQSTMFGPRVLLRYYHNKKLEEIMRFRVGLQEKTL